MRKSYERPVVIQSDGLMEGVYMASGGDSDCYTVEAYIHQTPETGREDYRIQVNAKHNALDNHHSTLQHLIISFNQPVNFVSCSDSHATLENGDGTTTLDIKYDYHNNAVENIGLGDLVVTSDDGLAVTNCVLTCNHKCEQHDGL